MRDIGGGHAEQAIASATALIPSAYRRIDARKLLT